MNAQKIELCAIIAHNKDVPIGRDAQSVTSSAGGGSIGCEAKDVSEEDADCTRSAHGPTEPGNTPATSPPKTAREFDQAMRALGYSKRQAKAIAARGFKGLAIADSAEDAADLEALAERMKNLVERFERQAT
jgi:hypothetical protein